jgi:serine/threonine-protein kinase RsbW
MDSEQTLTFPGRFESLAAIAKFISRAAEDAGLDPRAAYAVQVAVDEACTNIIEHGYGGEDQGDVECTCRIDDEGLTVVLRDQGCSFDPNGAPPPDVDARLEDRGNSGLGIYLMRQLMDEVRFQCSLDTGNVLTMVKRKEQP